MNHYRIRYKKDQRGIKFVKADNVNGFNNSEIDSYIFKLGIDVVAVIPKDNVVSIEKVAGSKEEIE